jgi:predicted GNAT family acetyltransferase
MMAMKLTDNIAEGRFELTEDGHLAWATYRLHEGHLIIDYVFAPPELRGRGTAGRLMEGIVEEADARALRITPICGYAATWLRRHGR